MESAQQLGDVLRGRRVGVSGRLLSLTHAELASVVRAAGGKFVTYPPRGAFTLVLGDGGCGLADGCVSGIQRRALTLQAMGYPVEFLTEDEFLRQLGFAELAGSVCDRYVLGELAEILNVPAARIRRWIRAGLVRPVEVVCQLAYFDFRQVAAARQLTEWLESGVPLVEVRQQLVQLQKWMPGSAELIYALFDVLFDGRLLVRRGGLLIDGSGQQHFDFAAMECASADDEIVVPFSHSDWSVDALFDRALELEDAGQLTEAAEVYRQAIACEPSDAVLHFNLGNVLYGMQSYAEAVTAFCQAVRCDPCFAEAWNNLGNAYGAQQDLRRASTAFERALQLVPNYADAHINLAGVLTKLGQAEAAAEHRRTHERLSAGDRLQAHRAAMLRIVRAENGCDSSGHC